MDALQFTASLVSSLAWPSVVTVAGTTVWRKTPQEVRGQLFARLRKAGPVELEASEQAAQEVEQAAAAVQTGGTLPATELGRSTSGSARAAAVDDVSGLTDSVEARVDRRIDDRNLDQIKQLIRAAARWGWLQAGGEPTEFTPPLIAWTENGPTFIRRTVLTNPGDTVTLAPGSFIEASTGKPNTKVVRATTLDRSEDLVEPDRDEKG